MNIDELPSHADAHARTEARAEARRHQRIAVANRGGWPELERRHLSFGPFSTVTDERDGSVYTINRGEIDVNSANIAAFVITEHGDPLFLEAKR